MNGDICRNMSEGNGHIEKNLKWFYLFTGMGLIWYRGLNKMQEEIKGEIIHLQQRIKVLRKD